MKKDTAPQSSILNLNEIRCVKNRELTDDDIKNMAVSIGNTCLINPITLRRLDPPVDGKHHEVIAGRCRYFALQLLKRYELESDDYRIIDTNEPDLVAFVENYERRQLTIMEEVEHLAGLAKCHDYADIARMIGRNEKYVRLRMNLAQLNDHFKKALAEGGYSRMKIGHYEIISRYPAHIQKQLEDDWSLRGGNIGSVENFAADLNKKFCHQLSSAPFPLTGNPDCAKCPKRSQEAPWLFEELQSKQNDCCLDPECWDKKKTEKIKTDLDAIIKGTGKGGKTKPEDEIKIISSEYYVPPKILPKGVSALTRDAYEIIDDKNAKPNAYIAYGEGSGTYVHIRVNDKPTSKPAPPLTAKERLAQLQTDRMKLAYDKLQKYLDSMLDEPDEDEEAENKPSAPRPPLPQRPSPDMIIKLSMLFGVQENDDCEESLADRNKIDLDRALDWCWRSILESFSSEAGLRTNRWYSEDINQKQGQEICDLCGLDWKKFMTEAIAELPVPKDLENKKA